MISPDLAFYTFFAFSCMPSIHFLFWILLLSVFKRSSFFQDFEEQNWMSMIILSWCKSTLYSQNAIATWKKTLTYKQRFPLTLKVLATITSHWGSVNEPTLLSWKTFSMGGPKGVAKIEPMKTLFISFCSCLLHTYIHILYLCSKFTE